MKRIFKFYSIIWGVLFVLFNIISFASAGWAGAEKYTSSFWIGYIFITLCFIGQITCTHFALKDNNMKKTFYNISLITTSYTGLLLSFIFGGLCMIISPLPYWIGMILCAVVLVLNVIAVIKAAVAIDMVSGIDDKMKTKTFFIKTLTVDTESLMSRAKSDDIRAECKKVYEAVRYSDPMSSEALASIESEIMAKFAKLSEAVTADDFERTSSFTDEMIILLRDRNKKCKLLK